METLMWLISFILLVIVELCTMTLTTIWFAGGAAVAFLLSLFHVNLMIQTAAFMAISVILLIMTRPLAIKYVNNRAVKTNAESLIGQEAKVTEKIDNKEHPGTVSINGLEWRAKAEHDNEVIEKGEFVTIVKITGVTMIVKKKNTEV